MAKRLMAALLFGFIHLSAWAGGADTTTNYPVGIGVGTFAGGGIVDSGGTTSLSFVDAITAGLLNPGGTPVNPPAATVNIGGTGGGAVRANRFDNVPVTVTPRNANGTPNGDARVINVSVFVPLRAANQTGADAATRTRQQNSMVTKLGRNVSGATIGGGKLDLTDTATGTPNVNSRSTGWTNPAPPAPPVAPAIQVPLPNIGDFLIPPIMRNVALGPTTVDAFLSTLPITLVPQSQATVVGFSPTGNFELANPEYSALFMEGFFSSLPDGNPHTFSIGFIDVTLPAAGGGFLITDVAALLNPDSNEFLLGVNGLVPSGYTGWLDNGPTGPIGALTSSFNLVPEPNVLYLLVIGLAMVMVIRRLPKRQQEKYLDYLTARAWINQGENGDRW